MSTLRVRNWDRWQHYRKDRGQPPWIKIHRCLMRNPEWVSLTDAQRGQLVAIWLLAADRAGVIPASPAVIRKLCYMDSEPDLNLFTEKGFLENGVNMASAWRQHVTPETETETEGEGEGEKKALARTDRPTPSAVKAFREAAHRYPPKSWYEQIELAIGEDPVQVSRWRDLVTDWVGRGYNPQNIKGMLDAWQHGGIEDRRHGRDKAEQHQGLRAWVKKGGLNGNPSGTCGLHTQDGDRVRQVTDGGSDRDMGAGTSRPVGHRTRVWNQDDAEDADVVPGDS